MAHIKIPTEAPGIIGLFHFRPETAKPLNDLANELLFKASSLSQGERELIASFVSNKNNCFFCTTSHSAFATEHLGGDEMIVHKVKQNYRTAPISEKLKSLLAIAGKVQVSGLEVTEADIRLAKEQGATDTEIHDTVLIAAAFCMYNRYVDGLATQAPKDPSMYKAIAKDITTKGYHA